MKGVILYEGKSNINGDDIVVILTFQSKNIKTGEKLSLCFSYYFH